MPQKHKSLIKINNLLHLMLLIQWRQLKLLILTKEQNPKLAIDLKLRISYSFLKQIMRLTLIINHNMLYKQSKIVMLIQQQISNTYLEEVCNKTKPLILLHNLNMIIKV